METWFTVRQLSDKTKVPENTIRRYVETFKDFIDRQTQGNKKKYSARTIDIIKRVYPLYQEGKNTEEIYAILKDDFIPIIEIKQDNTEETLPVVISQQVMMQLIQSNSEAFKQIATVLEKISDQDREIQILREEVARLKDQQLKKGLFSRLFK